MSKPQSIDDIIRFLNATAVHAALVQVTCFRADSAFVNNRDVLNRLAKHSAAYSFLRDYDYVAESLAMIRQRTREAMDMLASIQ